MWLMEKEALLRKVSMTESERLRAEADAEERRGNGFMGCTWMGTEHPSRSYYRRAEDLRRLADLLEAPQRRAEKAKRTQTEKQKAFEDSLVEDRDF